MSPRSVALRPWLRLALLVSVAAALCLPLVSSLPSAAAPAAPRSYGPLPDKFLFNIGALPAPTLDRPANLAVGPDGTIYLANRGKSQIQRFSAQGEFEGVWGSFGEADGQFVGIQDIAVAPDGTVYVLDGFRSNTARVQQFSAEGVWLDTWHDFAYGGNELRSANSLAVLHDGSVLVTDVNRTMVEHFSARGEYLGVWVPPWHHPGWSPDDIAVAPDGTVYVIASLAHPLVRHFSAAGERLEEWTSVGQGDPPYFSAWSIAVAPDSTVYLAGDIWVEDQLRNQIRRFSARGEALGQWDARAWGLAVGHDEVIFASDSDANQVKRFTPDGRLLGTIGNDPATEGQFAWPGHIAVGPDRSIYVIDRSNKRVQRFAPDGTYLGKLGGGDSGQGQLTYLAAIAVASDGTVYVSDSAGNRIIRFSPSGEFIGEWSNLEAYAMEVAADGSLYLAGRTIVHLSPTGAVLNSFGSPAYPCLACFAPNGVAIAPDGSIYVTLIGFTTVEHYSAAGTQLGSWNYGGGGYNPMAAPTSISIGEDGAVYLGGYGDGMLRRFTLDGQPLGEWRVQTETHPNQNRPVWVAAGPGGRVYVANESSKFVEVYAATYPPGWRNEYYANTAFVGKQYGIRTTDSVAFDWGSAPPDPALDPGHFSARFQRSLILPSGVYTPTLDVQGGARLLIDDQVVIDASAAVSGTYTATVTLPSGGFHGLRVEYATKDQGSAVELGWQSGPKDEHVFLPTLRQGALPPPPSAPKR